MGAENDFPIPKNYGGDGWPLVEWQFAEDWNMYAMSKLELKPQWNLPI